MSVSQRRAEYPSETGLSCADATGLRSTETAGVPNEKLPTCGRVKWLRASLIAVAGCPLTRRPFVSEATINREEER